MAKAVATCTCKKCGEEFTKIKRNCYNRRDADSWEEWAESYYDICEDCYKKQQVEAAMEGLDEFEEQNNLPELTGTEKQIDWARRIRRKILEDFSAKYKDEDDLIASLSHDYTCASTWIDFREFTLFRLEIIVSNRIKEREAIEKENIVPEEERTIEIKYKDYKDGVFAGKIRRDIKDSYDSDRRTIEVVMKKKEDVQYVLDYYEAQKEKRRLEREAEERRTVTIRYKDYKDGVFADRIKKQVYDSYDSRKRTIDVILKSDEDAEFVKAYYDKPKAKKKAERRQKRYDLQDGLIDEYTITPETIDADKLTVEVPEELRNGIDKATA